MPSPVDSTYENKVLRSLTISEVDHIRDVAKTLSTIEVVLDGSVSVTNDNGDKCAEIWWYSEGEIWLIDLGPEWEEL